MASRLFSPFASRVERETRLDPVAGPLGDAVRDTVPSGAVKDALSGVWLGHPAHPMLTDLPIGFWTSVFVLDFVGGRSGRSAARRLVALGVLSALPAALTGASDWGDTTGGARRVGLVHAVANGTAVACYSASWWQRRHGRQLRGVAWGLAGATAATVGGYLGGHLLQELGVGADNTAFETRPVEWTRACSTAEVTDAPRGFEVAGAPAIVFRHRGELVALGGRCPHRGAPLGEGTVADEMIVCPWHQSCFRIADGTVARGPSAMPLPAYECRERGHDVEVRVRP